MSNFERIILRGTLIYLSNHNIKNSKCLAIAAVDPYCKKPKYKTILNAQTVTTTASFATSNLFWLTEKINCNFDIMNKIPRILKVNTKGNSTKAKRIEFV